jgi:hypothetical protein
MGARTLIERSAPPSGDDPSLGLNVPVRPKEPKPKVTRDTLAQKAQGPFQAVKREPQIALGPVVAKINAAASDVPNFCRYQPKIARFARSNPDNMAATIIFVLASQGTSWHNLVAWFPQLMEHVRENGGLYPYGNVPWKAVVFRGGGAIDDVWKSRNAIFKQVERAKSDLDVFAVLVTVPGLSLPKAGFAAQLIVGKWGCLDSINSSIFGVPLELMTVQAGQPGFISMKGFVENGKLSPKGHQKLELYIKFLDSIKLSASESVSEQLWDSWCDIVAGKIWHASSPRGALDVRIGKHRMIHPTYPGATNPNQPEFDLQDPVRHGSEAERMRNQQNILKKAPPEKRGQVIGRQHKELVTGESLARSKRDAAQALLDSLLEVA